MIEAFAGAAIGGIVADADESRIARIVAIGDGVITVLRLGEKTIQQIVPMERLALPDEISIKTNHRSQQRIGNPAQFIIIATGLLGRGGVMNIANDSESDGARHRSRSVQLVK